MSESLMSAYKNEVLKDSNLIDELKVTYSTINKDARMKAAVSEGVEKGCVRSLKGAAATDTAETLIKIAAKRAKLSEKDLTFER